MIIIIGIFFIKINILITLRMGGTKDQKTYVVIGGCGFLGRYVVEELLARGESKVIVLDVRESWKDERFRFAAGDITKPETLDTVFRGADCVIHTASPPHGRGYEVYYKVNVEGTRNVIDSCVRCGVRQLVFTSSASVVFDGNDIQGGDESLPYCRKHLDGYTETKDLAEREVLKANGRGGLLTVALRPSGIFGPRDVQAWPGFIDAARAGKSKFQLGAGENKMDWTYVENVAYAHVLAADRLTADSPIAGRFYFITNDEPIPFWDMAKYVWRELDYPLPSIVVPYGLAYAIAVVIDWLVWIVSPVVTLHPTFTSFRVVYAGAHRYFSIDRAKSELGYRPRVSLQDGMARTARAFADQRNPNSKKSQ